MDIVEILAAIGGLSGLAMGLVSLIGLMADRRKRAAEVNKLAAEANSEDCDAAQTVSMAAGNLVKLYDKRFCDLEEKLIEQSRQIETLEDKQKRLIQRFSARIAYLMSGIDELIRQIVDLRATPNWKPDEWSPEEDK